MKKVALKSNKYQEKNSCIILRLSQVFLLELTEEDWFFLHLFIKLSLHESKIIKLKNSNNHLSKIKWGTMYAFQEYQAPIYSNFFILSFHHEISELCEFFQGSKGDVFHTTIWWFLLGLILNKPAPSPEYYIDGKAAEMCISVCSVADFLS